MYAETARNIEKYHQLRLLCLTNRNDEALKTKKWNLYVKLRAHLDWNIGYLWGLRFEYNALVRADKDTVKAMEEKKCIAQKFNDQYTTYTAMYDIVSYSMETKLSCYL